jgi:hypothetical protein
VPLPIVLDSASLRRYYKDLFSFSSAAISLFNLSTVYF